MNLQRTSGTPQGPGMVSGQHIPPIQAHSGTPGPSSCGSTTSSAIGSLANSLHLKMPSGGGMAPQSNVTESPIHLPALSPRRQVLTSGKPRFQVTQAGGMSGPHTLKPKQQEFGSPFPPNSGKGRIVFLGSFKSGHCCFSLPCLFSASKSYGNIHDSVSGSKSHNGMQLPRKGCGCTFV